MAEFRLPVANPNYRIKPGQFVKAEVFTESHEVIVLPGESLLKQDGVTRVAVHEDGQFTLKEVDTKNLCLDTACTFVLAQALRSYGRK